MLSFLARRVPRTRTSHLDVITFDTGHSRAEFKAPSDRYLVTNRLPPALSSSPEAQQMDSLPHEGADPTPAPPLHRHVWQEETFHVLSGTAGFTLGSGRAEAAETGPRRRGRGHPQGPGPYALQRE